MLWLQDPLSISAMLQIVPPRINHHLALIVYALPLLCVQSASWSSVLNRGLPPREEI